MRASWAVRVVFRRERSEDIPILAEWLWPERCTILGCPRWLDLWLARVRGGEPHLS
jgi:hypothetical protein